MMIELYEMEMTIILTVMIFEGLFVVVQQEMNMKTFHWMICAYIEAYLILRRVVCDIPGNVNIKIWK